MFARLVFRGLVPVTIHPSHCGRTHRIPIPIPVRLRSLLPGADMLTVGLNGILVVVLAGGYERVNMNMDVWMFGWAM